MDGAMPSGTGLETFPLIEAMAGRRSRRFGKGMEVPHGPLAYRSEEPAAPLSPIERQVVTFAAAGVTGYTTGMENTAAAGPTELCSYPVRFVGRTGPSAAGVGASELLITDDSGTYITQVRDRRSVDDLLPRGSIEEVAARFWDSAVHRLSDSRIDLPREAPHYSPHNIWNGNTPGSTLLVPLVDLSELLLDFLVVYLGAGFIPWNTVTDAPVADLSTEARAGVVDLDKRFSLQEFEQYIMACGAVEASLMCNQSVLMLQGMGLGGWMFSGIDPLSLLGGRPGVSGAGFAFIPRPRGLAPVCVGLEGYMEAYSAPWHATPESAVDSFLDRKYGPEGTYSGEYRTGWQEDQVVQHARRPTEGLVSALRKIVTGIVDQYGVFPATVPPVYARFYAQAHHVEIGFYERFYAPEMLLSTHRHHDSVWHP